MSSASDHEQIIDLQTRLAYQEDTLTALNDMVAAQHQRIEQLAARIEHLNDRLSALPQGDPSEPESPPPHY